MEQLLERVSHWLKERQQVPVEILLEMERQDTCEYQLSDPQAREVARIQLEVREGGANFVTDERMDALWKSCGL